MPSLEDPAVARQLFVGSGAMIVADAKGAIATIHAPIENGATDIQFFRSCQGSQSSSPMSGRGVSPNR